MSGGYTDKAGKVISDATWLEKRPSPSIPESVVGWEIGKGESSVVATALHEPSARVVIDDPRAVLLELRTAGMWLSDAVIARVLRTAGIKP